MSLNPAEALRRQRATQKNARLLRKENLFEFAKEICGYDLLKEHFHGGICDWLTEHQDNQYLFWSAARGHYKTTLQIADVVQDIIADPTKTHLWTHNALSQAAKACEEIAWHFQYNDEIRSRWPEHCAPKKTQFYRSPAQDGLATFNLPSRKTSRSAQPTMTACSIKKDITGMHISGSVRMDDLIGKETVSETAGLQKVRDFWKHTVIPVMDPGCRARNTGTRWDAADLYGVWIQDPAWPTLVRAVYEDEEGNPDWAGKNVGVLSDQEVLDRKREMEEQFGPQMMNDPAPVATRIWNQSACEHPLLNQEMMRQGAGKVVLLGDPAPLNVGSPTYSKEKERPGGVKDDWAWCVVRIRRNGSRQEIILLDGSFSKLWDEDAGMDEGARLAKKWCATHAGIESPGGLGGSYNTAWKRACQRNGIRCMWMPLKNTNKKDSKNQRVASLASRARQMEFLVCESCPRMFLDKLLEQLRPYRKTAPGKNNLQHDDLADVVSYSTDPSVDEIAPAPERIMTDEDFWFEQEFIPEGPAYGRYI